MRKAIVLSFFVIAAIWQIASAETPSDKGKTEYKVVLVDSGAALRAYRSDKDREKTIKAWNALGDDGWELVAVTLTESGLGGGLGPASPQMSEYCDYFKRTESAELRKHWEYKILDLTTTISPTGAVKGKVGDRVESKLMELAADGWDLATAIGFSQRGGMGMSGSGGIYFHVFKRAKK